MNINESNALLLYRVGPVLVCSPTMPVEAVVMPPKITVPPGASVAEPGVFKSIHGMVRLVDLRVRFGVEENDFTSPGRIVIVEVEGGHAGFWVDEIEDVISFPGNGWSPVPAYIPKNIFSKTLVQENAIRLYADFESLDKFKASGYLRQHIAMLKADKNITGEKISDVTEAITSAAAAHKMVDKSDADKIKMQSRQETVSLQDYSESNKDELVDSIKSDVLQADTGLTAGKKISDIPIVPRLMANEGGLGLKSNYKDSHDKCSSKIKKENKIISSGNFHSIKSERTSTVDAMHIETNRSQVKKHPKSLIECSPLLVSNKVTASVPPRQDKKISGITTPVENTGSHWPVKFAVAALMMVMIYFMFGLIDFKIFETTSNHQTEVADKKIDNSVFNENKLSAHEDGSLRNDFHQDEKEIETGGEPVGVVVHDDFQEAASDIRQEEIIAAESREGSVEIIKSAGEVIIVVNDVDASEAGKANSDNYLITDNIGKNIPSNVSENIVIESAVVEKIENKTTNESKNELLIVSEIDANKLAVAESEKGDVKHKQQQIKHDVAGNNSAAVLVHTEGNSARAAETESLSVSGGGKAEIALPVQSKRTGPQSKKYIHLVVKGDTLWHIAKRYVNNPWRYPELARLSKIKNPDLIYPGNKVIIIINYRETTP